MRSATGPRRCSLVLAVSVLALAAPLIVTTASPGASGPQSATIVVAQAFDPGAGAVDVVLDGRICALRSVAYGTVDRPLSLPSGVHTLSVRPADGACGGGPDAGQVSVEVGSGATLALVVRPDGNGGAALSAPAVDLSDVPTYQGRVTVHNDLTGGTVTASLVRTVNNLTPRVDTDPLAAGEASPAQPIWVGSYELTVTTPWGSVSRPVDVVEARVLAVHVMGSGPGDLVVVVGADLAANAEYS